MAYVKEQRHVPKSVGGRDDQPRTGNENGPCRALRVGYAVRAQHRGAL